LLTGFIWGIPAFSQVDTSCINLSQLNSSSDEYLPFLVDSSLLFTSNRKNTLEGQTLEYTEKVYISHKKAGQWGRAKKVGYKWNSDNNTALVGVSLKSFFYYRSYWKDNGEIFIAPRKEDTLIKMKAKHLQKVTAICTDFDENSITTVKEDTFYFVSNRDGNNDIYMQTGTDKAVAVDILNSKWNEQDLFLSGDGKSLYFSSDRPGGRGGFDIYKSKQINGHWTTPEMMDSRLINTVSDDRDFRWYNDSTMFLSSDRNGGMGGLDIYEIMTRKIPGKVEDTIRQEKAELVEQLVKLDIPPFKCQLQLGAYRFIKSAELFKKTFPCIEKEDLRVDTQIVEGKVIFKYIINKTYTDIDEALTKQLEILNRRCLPDKDFQDMPFVAILDQSGKRYTIFWKRNEFETKSTFNIYSNGKLVWKGRRF